MRPIFWLYIVSIPRCPNAILTSPPRNWFGFSFFCFKGWKRNKSPTDPVSLLEKVMLNFFFYQKECITKVSEWISKPVSECLLCSTCISCFIKWRLRTLNFILDKLILKEIIRFSCSKLCIKQCPIFKSRGDPLGFIGSQSSQGDTWGAGLGHTGHSLRWKMCKL